MCALSKVVHTDFFVDDRPMNILLHRSYQPCCGVPISVVGRYVREVEALDPRTPPLVLVIAVHCEKGRMVISCESSLRIKNFTNMDLEVLAWHDGNLESAGVIEAGGSLPIPVMLASSSEIRVRPAHCQMTSSPLLVTTGALQQVVKCYRPETNEVTILDTEVFAEADLIPARSSNNEVEALQLCVYPPLTLRNFLPATVQYTLTQSSAKAELKVKADSAAPQEAGERSAGQNKGSVGAGDDTQIFCVSTRNQAEIHIEIVVLPTDDHEEKWTGVVRDPIQAIATAATPLTDVPCVLERAGSAMLVYDKKKPDATVDVDLRDKDGRVLPAQFEFVDQRTLTVHAACWVQNRTGVSLKYKCQGRAFECWSDGGSSRQEGAGRSLVEGCAEVCMVPLTVSESKLSIGLAHREKSFSRSIDTSKLDTQIITIDTVKGETYTFQVQIDTAPGAFAKAKLITITPCYVAANNLETAVTMRQMEDGEVIKEVELPPGGKPVPFHPYLKQRGQADIPQVHVQIVSTRRLFSLSAAECKAIRSLKELVADAQGHSQRS